MMPFKDQLIIVLLDKGLLALALLLLAAIISRSLERLKSTLSINAELTKQRIDAAKRTISAAHELKKLHLQAIGSELVHSHSGDGPARTFDPRQIFDASERLTSLKLELSLLQASPNVLERVDELLTIATNVIGQEIPGTPGQIDPSDGSIIQQPSKERVDWFSAEQQRFDDAAKALESEMADGFRADVGDRRGL